MPPGCQLDGGCCGRVQSCNGCLPGVLELSGVSCARHVSPVEWRLNVQALRRQSQAEREKLGGPKWNRHSNDVHDFMRREMQQAGLHAEAEQLRQAQDSMSAFRCGAGRSDPVDHGLNGRPPCSSASDLAATTSAGTPCASPACGSMVALLRLLGPIAKGRCGGCPQRAARGCRATGSSTKRYAREASAANANCIALLAATRRSAGSERPTCMILLGLD